MTATTTRAVLRRLFTEAAGGDAAALSFLCGDGVLPTYGDRGERDAWLARAGLVPTAFEGWICESWLFEPGGLSPAALDGLLGLVAPAAPRR